MVSSNTIVRNGMPFIGKVLRQAVPFMDELIITISEKSDDGTVAEIDKLFHEFPKKIIVDFENVPNPSDLSTVRMAQKERTKSEWILVLDDDDYWEHDDLRACIEQLDSSMTGYCVRPYQLTDLGHYDKSWDKKWLTKFFKQNSDWIHPWPKDIQVDEYGKMIFWKTNPRVKRLEQRFYHLSYLKDSSFRTEAWAKKYNHVIGEILPLPKPILI